MKTIALGDTHGRSFWKLITHLEQADRVIFMGDYFDSRDDISAAEQMFNFKEIVHYKETHPDVEVVMLIGNHDHVYFPEIDGGNISGYQFGASAAIGQVLDDNRHHLQMCYKMDEYLFSHAGVSSAWLKSVGYNGKDPLDQFINDVWKYQPRKFDFTGWDMYGDNITQTPIWIRPASLMRSNRDTLRKQVIQVVGHTTQDSIDIKGKATGGRYYFIDTLGTSGEYLIIEDGIVSSKSYK